MIISSLGLNNHILAEALLVVLSILPAREYYLAVCSSVDLLGVDADEVEAVMS